MHPDTATVPSTDFFTDTDRSTDSDLSTDTDPGEALLRLLEATPQVARTLDLVADFDITRRTPRDRLLIPAGLPLHPIAADGTGGTYYLVGDPREPRRPVLYADREGCGTLIAEDLAEALAIFIALGFWHEAGHGFPLETTEQNLRESEPDIDTIRAGLYAATGIDPLTPEQARDRLLAAASRTAPDYVAVADAPGARPYHLLFGPPRGIAGIAGIAGVAGAGRAVGIPGREAREVREVRA
ncbi:hypothetical protein ABH926_009093 [Catenulispora sp. GP43]|uniref:hypothetical protein n=1 Tax=Catenulispora sp. GP43 TaxID=3156263 RepID=UPI0035120D02